MVTRIVHLSDLHFEAIDPPVVAALAADIRADPPDLVVVSGDLTMAARRREFAAARDFLDSLSVPTLCVPGNHDVSPYRLAERFLDPWAPWRRYIAPETEPNWSNGAVTVVGLNSARAIGYTLDWSEGRLNRRQIGRAARAFEAAGETAFRIVVSHHPFVLPAALAAYDPVGRAKMAIRALSALRVRLILVGHVHRGFSEEFSTTDFPELPRPAPMLLSAASATSTRRRGEPNGYHVLRVASDGFAVERRFWNGNTFESVL